MAKQFDKTVFKSKVSQQKASDQLEDLVHLQDKKKRLGRQELFKRVENELQSST